MEDLELDNTKKKLFQKALEVANHDGSTGAAVVPQHQHQAQFAGPPSLGPPLRINLDATDGGIEHAGVSYHFPKNQSDGQFSVGGNIEPGYGTTVPGYFPGETMEHNVPTNYRVNAGYGTPNYQLNFSHGTRGYGVNLRSQMQF